MTWESTYIGDAGEGLFKRLAIEWGASFLSTPEAQGTDGYLHWHDVPGLRLWVQVKTIRQRMHDASFVSVYVRPETLAEWYTYRPLLVVCELQGNRAWWLDTAQEWWPWGSVRGKTFRVRTDQPVGRTTKEAIQRIALRRSSYLPRYVYMPHATNSIQAAEYFTLRSHEALSPERMQDLLRNAYAEMNSVGILERDVIALAAARVIHAHLPRLSSVSLDSHVALVSARLLSEEWGGRSFTFGALASLVQPSLSNPIGDACIDILTTAADQAVELGSFLNPEFALLITASLAERFPARRDLCERLEYQCRSVIADPQNLTLEHVATTLLRWLNQRDVSVNYGLSPDWLTLQVVRPLPVDADVFVRGEEAEAAVNRILKGRIRDASVQDLNLADQLVRCRAAKKVEEWLSH